MNCTTELNPCKWHILATKRLDSTLFSSVQDSEEAFIKINEQWLFEPQQITKTILRADILQDTKFLPEKGSGLLRTTYRSLLPRSPHKDTFIFQKVELISSSEAVIVEYTPLCCPGDPELPSDFTDFDITTLVPSDCCQDKYPSFHPEVSGYRLYISQAESVVRAYACFSSDACLDAHLSKATHLLGKMLDILVKFMSNHMKGYVKRVNHDVVIPKVQYQNAYHEIKGNFHHWVAKWPEATDPAKFVFEELGIATFLHLLWDKKSTFVDLGCGNGFLTHVLAELGHTGKGIDISRRQLWEMYPKSTVLEGAKYSGVMDGKVGKYENYCLYLQEIMKRCGYIPEPEYLRIPSTKNLAWVGRKRTFERDDKIGEEAIRNQIKSMIQGVQFQPRKSDREKSKIQAEKKRH